MARPPGTANVNCLPESVRWVYESCGVTGIFNGISSKTHAPNPPAPDGAAPPVQQLPANHLMETVLPVRPALIDRGSAARLKPGMLAELVGSGSARAVVLSGRQALVSGNSLVLLDAAELAGHLANTPYAPEHVIYLGSALAGSDLDAGTELVLFVLPAQFEVRAEEFEAHVAGIPATRSGPVSVMSPPA